MCVNINRIVILFLIIENNTGVNNNAAAAKLKLHVKYG